MTPDQKKAYKGVKLVLEAFDLNGIGKYEGFSAVCALFFILGKKLYNKEELKSGFVDNFENLWNAVRDVYE